jgi:GTPase SAR1 family protein
MKSRNPNQSKQEE